MTEITTAPKCQTCGEPTEWTSETELGFAGMVHAESGHTACGANVRTPAVHTVSGQTMRLPKRGFVG
jgi:hypothetical protein